LKETGVKYRLPDMEGEMKKILFYISLVFVMTINATIIRKPAVAGYFYPAEAEELVKTVAGFFAEVEKEKIADILPLGIISPHAGIGYSGQVAAYGYSLLEENSYDTIILIGSSHNYFKNNISIFDGDFCQTPLGKIEIDQEISKQILRSDPRFVFDPQIHKPEHSLEVQLPFLQYKLTDFQVVLILTSTNDEMLLNKLADTIIQIKNQISKKLLFICSSDLSHYHSYKTACKMDSKTIELITNQDLVELRNQIYRKECEMCGYNALIPFIKVMSNFGSEKGILLKYLNSGDVIGDFKTQVVGYCSIVFPQKSKQEEIKSKDNSMSKENKEYLLSLARECISYYLEHNKQLEPGEPDSQILKQERAVFVTLNKNDDLRGCIGHMQARTEIYKAVAEMAVSAAFQDPRFPPVSEKELSDISIEISILSPLEKIDDYRKIRMGTDGVWVQKGFRSGVYLPQVATETGWDRETFMQSLCAHKAGLPADAYLDKNTDIFIFQVEKFSEKNIQD